MKIRQAIPAGVVALCAMAWGQNPQGVVAGIPVNYDQAKVEPIRFPMRW